MALNLKILLFTIFGLLCSITVNHAQSFQLPRGSAEHLAFDRMDILSVTDSFGITSAGPPDLDFAGIQLYSIWKNFFVVNNKTEIIQRIARIYPEMVLQKGIPETDSVFISSLELFEKPVLRYFFKSKGNFWYLKKDDFQLIVNPCLNIWAGSEMPGNRAVFQNSRGLDIRGNVGKNVYFYMQLLDNQRNFNTYTEDWISEYKAIPGQGFKIDFQSSVIQAFKGYDFFYTKAYTGVKANKYISIELGHGNHFIGNGFRSLLLSDFSHNYLYLKFNTRFWKLNYTNIFAELSPVSELVNNVDQLLPKKYSATHYLAYRPIEELEIGAFESVIFSRENVFEFQYLNPLIFYRAVEHYIGSPDNILLGVNLKWNFLKRFSLYGQFLLDEFRLGELRNANGWWGSKFGGQTGLKYMNAFGIEHFDVQLEYNIVRPYTYAHWDTLDYYPDYSVASYSHANQSLAHPLGSNFKERILICRYQPTMKWHLNLRLIHAVASKNPSTQNLGSNILLPTGSRSMEYGNYIGQGEQQNILHALAQISYEFYPNYFIDFKGFWRKTVSSSRTTDLYFTSLGIRANFSDQFYDY